MSLRFCRLQELGHRAKRASAAARRAERDSESQESPEEFEDNDALGTDAEAGSAHEECSHDLSGEGEVSDGAGQGTDAEDCNGGDGRDDASGHGDREDSGDEAGMNDGATCAVRAASSRKRTSVTLKRTRKGQQILKSSPKSVKKSVGKPGSPKQGIDPRAKCIMCKKSKKDACGYEFNA